MSVERRNVLSKIVTTTIVVWFVAVSFVSSIQFPKPDRVMVPVPFDRLDEIQWLSDPGIAETTCGTFKAYPYGDVKKVIGRWYTVYTSNLPTSTEYCSQFSNVQQPCRCSGIDFTLDLKDGIVSFAMFSTNATQNAVTYELGTAQMNGKTQLNMYQIVVRRFLMQSNSRILPEGGYIVPYGVVVDTDEFNSYMILLFCLERGFKPVIMVLANTAPPLSTDDQSVVFNYLTTNGLDVNLYPVDHNSKCKYGQNLVGLFDIN